MRDERDEGAGDALAVLGDAGPAAQHRLAERLPGVRLKAPQRVQVLAYLLTVFLLYPLHHALLKVKFEPVPLIRHARNLM